jgi:hypothetical protein
VMVPHTPICAVRLVRHDAGVLRRESDSLSRAVS